MVIGLEYQSPLPANHRAVTHCYVIRRPPIQSLLQPIRFMFCHHLLLLVTAAAFVAADESLRLYHRVYHPIVPELPFALRGTVNINDSLLVTFRPSESISESLQQFADSLQPGAVGLHDAQYQVALERAGDTAEAHWDISSVKLVSTGSPSRLQVACSGNRDCSRTGLSRETPKPPQPDTKEGGTVVAHFRPRD